MSTQVQALDIAYYGTRTNIVLLTESQGWCCIRDATEEERASCLDLISDTDHVIYRTHGFSVWFHR